jgi:hydroxymethylpyrimidine pyrophosphatase-like HAD family hydrolase
VIFVEVMAGGISKAWGLARLCDQPGITADEVLAFGDAPTTLNCSRGPVGA